MDYNKILNKNALKILEVLSKEQLYFNQIHELTEIKSKNNLLKNLGILVELKILQKKQNKSNTFYKINYQNNFSQILLQVINVAKFQKLPFDRKNSIKDVINETLPTLSVLFGSSAKGNFKKESDIDILLVYNTKVNNIKNKIQKISSRYGMNINPIVMTFNELDIREDAIKHMLKTGYPITGYNYFYEVMENA